MDAILDLDFWHLASLGAILLGFSNLSLAREEKHVPATRALLTVLSGYLAWRCSPDLLASGRQDELVALLFGFASAPIGWIIFSRGGAVLLFLLRTVLFFLVAFLSFLALSPRFPNLPALIGSIFIGTLVFLPLGKWAKRILSWITSRRSAEKAPALPASDSIQNLESGLEEARREAKASKKRIDRLEKNTEKSRRTAKRQEADRERRRTEIVSRVREILALSEGNDHDIPQYETIHGFLMLETSRVLRSQIEAGERNPPLELPPFYFDVLSELLASDDFEERYFHRLGQEIVRALNAFFRGECPLGMVRRLASELDHGHLAPRPFFGDLEHAVVEGWLVAFRRYQDRQCDLYQAGEHPRASELSAREVGDPFDITYLQWREAWDAEPWIFVTGNERMSDGDGDLDEESGLWNRISRFWTR